MDLFLALVHGRGLALVLCGNGGNAQRTHLLFASHTRSPHQTPGACSPPPPRPMRQGEGGGRPHHMPHDGFMPGAPAARSALAKTVRLMRRPPAHSSFAGGTACTGADRSLPEGP